ncbi:TetR/AcrR family transcriptional regulator [Shewanella sp. 1_MG-2023]|uniref:acrylate utilization transcriptional regulator AcuR n=1 Tax=unclassified Shewanella TaxID=196818 RepID=UPI0026E47FCC|nr:MULTISPECIES: TetR/AcrR family transcriptional regulator [unclassified Shewanella]MDO6611293.1 TetR/AcrR family transcriptional regulator [Shewanella sp. 7_MG-2023]MDO6771148.1 TetR/AcrR family transcriptional regulator [Shewanella sp. 2_MG-2023]MDO6795829.1 TetR/AcrR family transcriptional regulator [Shewanella sp. 1_MG-2023]
MTESQLVKAAKPRRGRPPKAARDNQDTRAELIRSGLEQLTEKGFASSGIDQILRKVGVPKGSFYYYFSSKEEFGQVVIDNYATYFAHKLDKHLLEQAYSPLARIGQFVESAKTGMARFEFKRGCLVGNLGQEVDLLPESYRQQLIDIFLDWQQRLSICLEAAKAQGEIAQSANCELLAEQFWVGWEGAVSRAKLVQSTQPLQNYLEFFIAGLPR